MTIEMVVFSSVCGHNIIQEAPKGNDLQLLIHLLTQHITILYIIPSTITIQASVHSVVGQHLQPVPRHVTWYHIPQLRDTHFRSHDNSIASHNRSRACRFVRKYSRKQDFGYKKKPLTTNKSPSTHTKTLVKITRPMACPKILPGAAL